MSSLSDRDDITSRLHHGAIITERKRPFILDVHMSYCWGVFYNTGQLFKHDLKKSSNSSGWTILALKVSIFVKDANYLWKRFHFIPLKDYICIAWTKLTIPIVDSRRAVIKDDLTMINNDLTMINNMIALLPAFRSSNVNNILKISKIPFIYFFIVKCVFCLLLFYVKSGFLIWKLSSESLKVSL